MTSQNNSLPQKPEEGWGYSPVTPRVFHYFRNHDSLCRKVGFFFGKVEQGNDNHYQNCKACVKKLQKEKDRAAAAAVKVGSS